MSVYSGLTVALLCRTSLVFGLFLVISETPSHLLLLQKILRLLHVFRLPTFCAEMAVSLGKPTASLTQILR